MIAFKRTINYILPIVGIIFIYLGINNIFKIENSNNSKLDNYTNQIKIYKKMLTTTNSIDILKDIENLSVKNDINIRKILHLNDEIKINYQSKYENSMKFLYKCEKLSRLLQFKSITFKLSQHNDSIDTNIVFKFGKKINIFKNTEFNHILNDPFVNNQKENIKFNLTAIVGDVAYINDSILSKGDMLFGYKIIDIKNSSVILQKDYERLILKVFNE